MTQEVEAIKFFGTSVPVCLASNDYHDSTLLS